MRALKIKLYAHTYQYRLYAMNKQCKDTMVQLYLQVNFIIYKKVDLPANIG